MLVVNLIDKDRVRGEDGFGDSRAIWRARLFLFISFALMAGGLAGSVVSISFRHFFETFLSPRVQNMCLTRVFFPDRFSPVRLNPQVHPQQLPRDVQVLRLLQRFAEHWVNALRSRALDIPEHQRRVRVQPHHINTPSFPNRPSTRLRRFGMDSRGSFSGLVFFISFVYMLYPARDRLLSTEISPPVESVTCLLALNTINKLHVSIRHSLPRPRRSSTGFDEPGSMDRINQRKPRTELRLGIITTGMQSMCRKAK